MDTSTDWLKKQAERFLLRHFEGPKSQIHGAAGLAASLKLLPALQQIWDIAFLTAEAMRFTLRTLRLSGKHWPGARRVKHHGYAL
jgi:hypothetical protein